MSSQPIYERSLFVKLKDAAYAEAFQGALIAFGEEKDLAVTVKPLYPTKNHPEFFEVVTNCTNLDAVEEEIRGLKVAVKVVSRDGLSFWAASKAPNYAPPSASDPAIVTRDDWAGRPAYRPGTISAFGPMK